jgi:hypothetical protein
MHDVNIDFTGSCGFILDAARRATDPPPVADWLGVHAKWSISACYESDLQEVFALSGGVSSGVERVWHAETRLV